MFPYFWNSSSVSAYPIGFVSRRGEELRDLPEEVRESIEQHREEFRSEEDIRHFVHELDMKK